MQKNILLILLFVPTIMLAKKKVKNCNKSNVVEIKMNYNDWNNVTNNLIQKRLKIGDIVHITCRHIPDSLKMSIKLSYDNRFLDNGNMFSAWTKYEPLSAENKKTEETNTPNQSNSEETNSEKDKKNLDDTIGNDSLSKNVRMFAIETFQNIEAEEHQPNRPTKSFNSDFSVYDSYYEKKLNFPYKTNLGNLEKSLTIGDAQNFIDNTKTDKNDTSSLAAKAKIDLKWQKKVIGYFKNNQTKIDNYHKEYIALLKQQRDSLNQEILDSTHTEHLHFRVENYDNTVFKIQIKNDRQELIKKTSYSFKNRGSFKIDFSTGLSFNCLMDESYEILKVDKPIFKDSTGEIISKDTISIVQSSKNFFNAGPIILAHGYFRSGRQMAVGFAAGLSYNFQNENLNYVLGGSVLFGQEQRMVVTGGVFLGKRKVLPASYKINYEYDREHFEKQFSATLNYHEIWDYSFGMALSYNLNVSNFDKKDLNID